MSDSVQFSLIGLEPLLAKLQSVSYDMQYKGGRFALRKAANIVADALRTNAKMIDDPETPEDISKNVAVRFSTRTFKRNGNLMFRVGILGGASFTKKDVSGLAGGDTRHWRMQEMGTEHHPAQPFMRRSLSENIGTATNEFISQYEKALDRAIKRATKGK